MPSVNITDDLSRNSSQRLSNLKLPGAEDAEHLQKEQGGVGFTLIEILVMLHLIPLAYWIFVVIRQAINQADDGVRWDFFII